jgi:hypothetical protein
LTAQDLESQRLNHETEEVKEIVEYMKEAKNEMKEAYVAAKKMPPPPSQHSIPDPPSATDRNRQWTATSTIDIVSEIAMV